MSLEKYLETYKNFKKGNYKYHLLRDTEWATKLIHKGKKIVLPTIMEANYIIVGAIFGLIMVLIIYIISVMEMRFDLLFHVIFWSATTGLTLPFLILGLYKRRKEFFFVLGSEGILHKDEKRNIKFIYWENIVNFKTHERIYNIKNSHFKTKITELSLADGDKIEIDPFVLEKKEFPKEGEIGIDQLNNLVAFVIKEYHDHYRK